MSRLAVSPRLDMKSAVHGQNGLSLSSIWAICVSTEVPSEIKYLSFSLLG